jgi:hypothetical protein
MRTRLNTLVELCLKLYIKIGLNPEIIDVAGPNWIVVQPPWWMELLGDR